MLFILHFLLQIKLTSHKWYPEVLVTSSNYFGIYSLVVVQSLSYVQLFVTLWTAVPQVSLSITNSWSLLKLMSIKLVMPSNHLILCPPLLLLP